VIHVSSFVVWSELVSCKFLFNIILQQQTSIRCPQKTDWNQNRIGNFVFEVFNHFLIFRVKCVCLDAAMSRWKRTWNLSVTFLRKHKKKVLRFNFRSKLIPNATIVWVYLIFHDTIARMPPINYNYWKTKKSEIALRPSVFPTNSNYIGGWNVKLIKYSSDELHFNCLFVVIACPFLQCFKNRCEEKLEQKINFVSVGWWIAAIHVTLTESYEELLHC
jgi:hypothetical protein